MYAAASSFSGGCRELCPAPQNGLQSGLAVLDGELPPGLVFDGHIVEKQIEDRYPVRFLMAESCTFSFQDRQRSA